MVKNKNFILTSILMVLSISLLLANTVARRTHKKIALSASRQTSSVTIDSPISHEARTPKFSGLDTSFLNTSYSSEDIYAYKKRIEMLNQTQEELWKRKVWNLNYFNEQNLPVIVGEIKNPRLFSSLYQNHGLRFLDLPIHMPDQGWRIPVELAQFKEVIKAAIDHERLCYPEFEKDHYVYITVDQGNVEPQTSQRRAGWHSDSYRRINHERRLGANTLVDHVYVIYDTCPTLYIEGPFSFNGIDPNDIDQVLKMFSLQAEKKEKRQYPNYTLLRMDPYCIHDAGINDTSKPINRTFVKVSFSKTKYRHLGNAHNNLFIYDWPMVPRKGVPYTKATMALSAHRDDRDLFLEIDPSEIDFEYNLSNVPWASKNVKKVSKNGTIYAEPAREGDIIETKNNNSIVTISVAEQGDYKIIFSPNDMWFLSGQRFQEIYEPITDKPNVYKIKKNERYAVQLKQKVRMRAPWGTLAYAVPGDYLVYRTSNDVYFVSQPIFEKSYKVL